MSTQIDSMSERLVREGNIFRNTNIHSGRTVVITPKNSSMQHLCYARTRLDSASSEVSFHTANSETGIICLSGQAEFVAGGNKFMLEKYDAAKICFHRPRTRPDRKSTRLNSSHTVISYA